MTTARLDLGLYGISDIKEIYNNITILKIMIFNVYINH